MAVITILVVALVAVPVTAQDCRLGDRPSATLLFPFFEVDLDGGPVTLISITNTGAASILAHVVVWTDWGVPTLSFDLFLKSSDVQTINLRDVFLAGTVPVTGPGIGTIAGCSDTPGATLGGYVAPPVVLQLAHTGRNTLGQCMASPRGDTSLATGYITVDAATRCSSPSTTPATAGYFSGPTRIASQLNVLWGDMLHVDSDGNFASGMPAVHVVADPGRFEDGDYTFYGKFVDFDGSDARVPLTNRWGARFLIGGGFDGGTQLIVWRDNRSADTSAVDCGSEPDWVPLGESYVIARDENAVRQDFGTPRFFDLATQRVDVHDVLDPTASFGWLSMNLNHSDGTAAQAWVGWEANAEGRYNVGLAGVPMTNPCGMRP